MAGEKLPLLVIGKSANPRCLENIKKLPYVSATAATVLAKASMAGEKLPLLVIGKSANPRCFKNIKKLLLPNMSQTRKLG